MKPTNCPLDIVTGKLLVEVFNIVGPSPAALKHAVVRPLLKKLPLEPSVLSNFIPVSHLPFLSEVLEKVVCKQLQSFFEDNDVFDQFQSRYRSCHSTESALLKVHNAILHCLLMPSAP